MATFPAAGGDTVLAVSACTVRVYVRPTTRRVRAKERAEAGTSALYAPSPAASTPSRVTRYPVMIWPVIKAGGCQFSFPVPAALCTAEAVVGALRNGAMRTALFTAGPVPLPVTACTERVYVLPEARLVIVMERAVAARTVE